MDLLPNELVLLIASFLPPVDLVNLQRASQRFLKLGRDNKLWKNICFEHSRAEAMRRRQLLFSQRDSPLVELARAVDNLSACASQSAATESQEYVHRSHARSKIAIRANWDPSYPSEKLNFYQEYIHRHAPIQLSWLQFANDDFTNKGLYHEAVGMGLLYDDEEQRVQHVVAPLEDGSIAIWDASLHDSRHHSQNTGRIVGRSPMGLLSGLGPEIDRNSRLAQSKAMMTDIGAVECVSVDTRLKRAFIAVKDLLNEVDLETLQIVSRTPYPFSITAVSEARHPTPLTVGTNTTLHLHDPRQSVGRAAHGLTNNSSVRCELIGGAPPVDVFIGASTGNLHHGHATLAQPGPLSILHTSTSGSRAGNGDIWIAGRFTSLLNYDRRVFPRLRGTVHSGARLSCITSIPHHFVPLKFRSTHREPSSSNIEDIKSIPGHTIIAAGEYKTKGSLELYSLSSDPSKSIISTESNTKRKPDAFYHNRQTASSSKLLSATSHGGCIIFTDGNGNVKWVERDGFTPVRQFNINDGVQPYSSRIDSMDPARASTQLPPKEDIVQKIVPTTAVSLSGNCKAPIGEDNLLIWTGDGKIGMIGFGHKPLFDAAESDEAASSIQDLENMRQEREYGLEIRRALERQAAELRWMKSYGL